MATHPFLCTPTSKATLPTCCLSLISFCYSDIHDCLLPNINFITLSLSLSFHVYMNISRTLLHSRLKLVPSVTQDLLCSGELAGNRKHVMPLLPHHHMKPFLEFISKQSTKQQTFQNFQIHCIFNFPRTFLQLYSCMEKSGSNYTFDSLCLLLM